MKQERRFSTENYNKSENTRISPMPERYQQEGAPNPTEQRKKRVIYTFIQILSVVFMLISFPLIIQGLIVIGPQFGKNVEATGTIKDITGDLGAVIDDTTGFTNLANGCQVYYSFVVDDKKYDGTAHSNELCDQPIGSKTNIVYNSSTPADNTISTTWEPYDKYLTVGVILLAASLTNIIIFSIMKRKTPKPLKNNASNNITGGSYQ